MTTTNNIVCAQLRSRLQNLETRLKIAKPLDIKEQCVHRQRFETLQHASRVIGDWIGFYNQKRPQQALRMLTPNQAFEMFKLAA